MKFGDLTTGSYKNHPYTRNGFKGTEEIQQTMSDIYEVKKQIDERRKNKR